ncbi:L,D-transpeptidase [uncultured Thiohalocapsa sp.]|uniref:L,D-transpeptidase n=1 Tax=uncultured Thiohalocapsa sp. TaxID=768990 RepID=UPI0025D2EAAA|nr:L,D-transpeptidase [uncultured Thiohalocapsa sp.]
MNPSALLWLAPLLLVAGCAMQPYPPLPGEDVAETPRAGMPGSAPVDGAATASDAKITAAARREAERSPVSQAVRPPPPRPASLPAADQRWLKILLGARRFEYYEDERMIWSGKISAGVEAHPTPRGEFRVTAKDIDKRSGSYTNAFNRPTPMPYALQFNGPYWVHEGYVPNVNASHGCVRLRHDDAKFVYQRMRIGDTVTVVD